MDLILNEMYEQFGARFQMELVAGSNGLRRPMKWVYVTEDHTTADFLRGGELIITTGVLSGNSSEWLMLFLNRMLERKTCGLVLNLGAYLSREILTPDILEFCDLHRYPLFVMPWHIHLYDVTRVFYEQIYIHTRRDENLRDAFTALLSQHGVDDTELVRLDESGFPVRGSYYVAALHSDDTEKLFSSLSEMIAHHSISGYAVIYEGYCCLIALSEGFSELKLLLSSCMERISGSKAGIGSRVHGITEVGKSYRHAKGALLLGGAHNRRITVYDETGLFRLLMDIPDRTALLRYSEGYLSSVHEYDRLHHTELAATLYLFVMHNGSVKAIAESAFCHRNTINHRLRILREDLGIDLDSPARRMELMSAFMVREFLEATELS